MSAWLRTEIADTFRRAFAAGGAALVLALTIFAASPVAHAWLHAGTGECSAHSHHHEPAPVDPDEGCVVVLFANGVDLPVGPAALTPPAIVTQGISPVTAAEFDLVSPRYLRQPERGPPSLG
jgi:hypothetical protein